MNTIERGISALNNHLQVFRHLGHEKAVMSLPAKLGMGKEDFERVKRGERLLSMKEFHALLDVFCPSMYIKEGKITWMGWFLDPPTFWLVGLLEASFTLKKRECNDILPGKAQVFARGRDAIIIDPSIPVEEGDSLFHILPNGMLERLVVEDVNHSLYLDNGEEPAYRLTVSRYKPEMKKDHRGEICYIGGDVNLGDNAHLNMGRVVDNSTNTLGEAPAELFEKVRILIETAGANQRQEILETVLGIKEAIAAKNKQEAGKWYSKFFRFDFVADCITVYPALAQFVGYVAQVISVL